MSPEYLERYKNDKYVQRLEIIITLPHDIGTKLFSEIQIGHSVPVEPHPGGSTEFVPDVDQVASVGVLLDGIQEFGFEKPSPVPPRDRVEFAWRVDFESSTRFAYHLVDRVCFAKFFEQSVGTILILYNIQSVLEKKITSL